MSAFVPVDGIIKLRASSLSGYSTECQLRTAVEMLGREFDGHDFKLRRRVANVAALIGTGVHGGAEVALLERMMGSVMPVSAMQEAAIETFRKRTAEETDGAELLLDSDAPSLGDAEKQVRRMTARYREDVVKTAHPIAVESRIEVVFRDNVWLSGQADLLHLTEDDSGRARIRDLKTSRHPAAAWKHGPQLGCYSLLIRSEGHAVDAGQIDYLRRVPVDRAQPGVEPHEIDIMAAERVAYGVISDFAAKAIGFAADGNPERFLMNPNSRLCHPNFCRAWGTRACSATEGLKE